MVCSCSSVLGFAHANVGTMFFWWCRALVFETRARSDAVIVGGNTVRRDNPRLTTRREGGHTPVRMVMSRTLDLPEVRGLSSGRWCLGADLEVATRGWGPSAGQLMRSGATRGIRSTGGTWGHPQGREEWRGSSHRSSKRSASKRGPKPTKGSDRKTPLQRCPGPLSFPLPRMPTCGM